MKGAAMLLFLLYETSYMTNLIVPCKFILSLSKCTLVLLFFIEQLNDLAVSIRISNNYIVDIRDITR